VVTLSQPSLLKDLTGALSSHLIALISLLLAFGGITAQSKGWLHSKLFFDTS